jgi:hypothetical protein
MTISTDCFHAQFQVFTALDMSRGLPGILRHKTHANEINQQNKASVHVTCWDEPIRNERQISWAGN